MFVVETAVKDLLIAALFLRKLANPAPRDAERKYK